VKKDLNQSKLLNSIIDDVIKHSSIILDDVQDSIRSLLITSLFEKTNKDILIITSGTRKDELFNQISSFKKDDILEFLSLDVLPNEDIEPSCDIIGQRYETLSKLLDKEKNKIVLTPLDSAFQKILTKEDLKKSLYKININDSFDYQTFVDILEYLGYEKTSVVSNKKEYALRGSIIDFFSTSSFHPIRVEFFDDKIESIRTFDAATQKSIEKISNCIITPANENSFLKNKKISSTIINYLEDPIIIFDDIAHIEDKIVSFKKLNPLPIHYLSFDEYFEKIKNNIKIYFSDKKIEDLSKVKYLEKNEKNQKITFEFLNKEITAFKYLKFFSSYNEFLNQDDLNIFEMIPLFIKKRAKIIFLSTSEFEEKHIKEILEKNNIPFENCHFKKGYLNHGFVINDIFLVIIPYYEITKRQSIRRQKWRDATSSPLAEFHHLKINDLVVHANSGIGKYLGCEKHKDHLGNENEFLIIEYQNSSKLYVPLSQAHLVTRYIGAFDEKPALNILGSTKWQKTKHQAQKQIIGYASDLLERQAKREIEKGYVFPKDSDELLLFEMDFPYQETTDQLKAINDIKNDLTSTKPMDRLICGDVGYGKTEVCMRAAFKAVYDGKKQVAVLVPTTVLAQQHYESFKQRMSSFPIKVDMVSRFKSPKENKQTIEDVKNGKIDILIGTHRILSKDVKFKDLGLLIIDEEQRFGVRAKEHLKKFKTNIDTITMSATPIPRTLYMSLIKIKDMSVINTPPQDRLPIKTIILENDDNIIKNAILRELSREGQVFFIHNRVESIYNRKDHIQKLIKDAKIQVAHGQLSSDEIDDVFHAFKNGKSDILFATTIVENGIDIPNANTILIDRADTFGLSDLHQLRGRVGRWNRSAYAYFITPKNKELSEISKKRLNALVQSSGYSAGIKIAMRDLEIRGAGDILGIKQSGQIASIGFHLYCKLLKKTIEALKNKKQTVFIDTKMEFNYIAKIPENYISDANLRMEIYYRLSESSSFQEADDLLKELEDRFSSPPIEVLYLINLTKIRIFASDNNFTLLKFNKFTLYAEKTVKRKTVTKTFPFPSDFESPNQLFEIAIKTLQNFI
jgi:transcription-repair coupling factor (superfamily II helicase)